MQKFLKKQKEKKENYANSSRRFLAYTIDIFIVNILRYILFLTCFFLWFSKSIFLFSHNYVNHANKGIYDIKSIKDFMKYFLNHSIFIEVIFIAIFILPIIGFIYWVLIPKKLSGSTIGKYILKIKIVTTSLEQLSIRQYFIRYIIGSIPWIFHIIIFIFIANNALAYALLTMILITFWYETAILSSNKRTIHDILCKTKVINNKQY